MVPSLSLIIYLLIIGFAVGFWEFCSWVLFCTLVCSCHLQLRRIPGNRQFISEAFSIDGLKGSLHQTYIHLRCFKKKFPHKEMSCRRGWGRLVISIRFSFLFLFCTLYGDSFICIPAIHFWCSPQLRSLYRESCPLLCT